MTVNLTELLALPQSERMRLAEALMASAVPSDMETLLRSFAERMEQTNQVLEAAIQRFETIDERIERDRAEIREAVRRSGDSWPFPLLQ
jgi:hypothetical protein